MKKFILAVILTVAQPLFFSLFDGGPHSVAGKLYGQTATVPPTYQDLYSALDADLSSFESTVNSSWNGSTYPAVYSVELTSAHSNQRSQLFSPNYYNAVLTELDSLKALGVKAVTVGMNFPILYSGFYQNPADYQQYINFYTQLTADIRARNLKLIVESVATESTSSDVVSFYSSLTQDQYNSGRMEVAKTIALTFKPDYLSVLVEPDTEAVVTGKSQLGTVSGSTALLNVILNGLRQAGVQGVPIGAGVGSWITSYQSFIQSFASTTVNYIDMHAYLPNYNYLPRLLQIADLASSYGKPVAMSEAWLMKIRDSELTTMPANQAALRDPLSFWAPLDGRFLTVLWKVANYKRLLFLSPFWSQWFHTYIDYSATTGLTPNQIFVQATALEKQQILAGQYTSTGLGYAGSIIKPPDATAPTTPPSLLANTVSAGINLLWKASTDNVGVAGYNIYRDGVQIATAATIAYQDTGVAPSSMHAYNIAAYDVSGNVSAQTASVWGTAPADTTPPTVPTQLTAQAVSISQINLTWLASTDNVAVASYAVYRNGSKVGTSSTASYSDTGLTPSTTYTYTVSATDTSGNTSALSAPVSGKTLADTTPPTAPTNLSGNSASATTVSLSWSGSTDNVSVAGYNIYRGTSASALTQVATTASTQYTGSNLASGTTYFYAVAAYDAAGNVSALSSTISVTTLSADVTPPSVPTNLSAKAASSSSINLSWSPSTDNVGVAGYKIYRGTLGSALSQIATTASTQYTDKNLAAGTLYYYAVSAYDVAGNTSARSGTVSARTKLH